MKKQGAITYYTRNDGNTKKNREKFNRSFISYEEEEKWNAEYLIAVGE